ncbi:putative glyoxalase superfamily protein PhnB [Pseudonocardia endophytica]|uniref:Putative glyoxalase superfamily protein PhnB n=1 Tax=Pseudonocardia endophytica TaxID=401976 RepID=A0A4R1HKV1_PSEEN|nr:putative glyoxalase superfamily protein PhnB [Pseudonocardia endophytica]
MLVYPDVRAAVAFLEAAFGFSERVRIGDAHRSQMRVGADGAVVVADDGGDRRAPSPDGYSHEIKLRVDDVDVAFARALEAGAVVHQEPVTHPYGERACVVEDPGGHRWELTRTVRDVDPAEWGGTVVAPW